MTMTMTIVHSSLVFLLIMWILYEHYEFKKMAVVAVAIIAEQDRIIRQMQQALGE